VVLADGRALQVGGKALDRPEYDWAGLLTGSEGTLAIITAATVRLCPPSQEVKALTACFSSVAAAGRVVVSRQALRPRRSSSWTAI
jgi:FAD/FMN-containing dehydrogenase